MGNVILGGLLAIVGGVAAQFFAHLWQSKRDQQARRYDKCSAAHLEFAREFNRVRDFVKEAALSYAEERPSDYGYQVDGELRNLLLAIQMFASPATQQAARAAIDRLNEWTRTDGKADRVAPTNTAFDEYLSRVHAELGAQRSYPALSS